MPPVVAAVAAALVAVGVGSATATIIATAVVGILTAVGTSLVSKALLGGADDFAGRGQTLSFRAASPPAPIIYGEVRAGGPIVFMATTDGDAANDNKLLWYYMALAGHEVAEIDSSIYFNNEAVAFYDESVQHPVSRLWGRASGTASSSPGGGLGRDNGHAHRIRHYGRHDDPADVNFNADVWNVKQYLGMGDRFRGIAGVSITLNWASKLFPGGSPNASALVKGRKVYDPREPSHDIDDPETWAWSANAALCIADYLRGVPMHTGGGVVIRPYGVGARDDEIDWDAVIEAANVCDESVQTLDGGSEARYLCNGTFDSDTPHDDVLTAMSSAMAGHVAFTGGKYVLLPGVYRTPAVTLGDDDQCGPSQTLAKRARRDLFNGVKGKFRGPKTQWQVTDFPAVGGLKDAPEYVEQDNGEEIWQDIELAFTTSPSACQRIARIELQRNRQQIVTERRFKLSALATRVGDVVLLNDPRKGWTDKPFEIHKWSLATAQDASGQPVLCIDMTLVETSSGVYDWTADDEYAFDDAPDTNLPRPWDVATPGAPGITEDLYQTRDGAGVRTRVNVSWADAGEGYFLDYIASYKLSADSAWTTLPPVTSASIAINDLAAGIYDFRVLTRNRLGVESEYSLSEGLTVYGLGAEPNAITGLGIQPLGNQAMLAWTQSVDLDVREGGFIEFRQSPAFSSVTWETATSIREKVTGGSTHATVPLKAGTYILRPVDSSGIVGPVTSVTSKQASINGYAALTGSPLTEESSFAGTHDFTVVDTGVLKLSNAGLWDDIADLDAELGDIDDLGGQAQEGSYTFANAYDFGAVVNVRLTSTLAASITTAGSGIDDRSEFIDEWADFDGDITGGQADAWVEFRQTDDDPSGSPAWSEWMRLDAAEAECRGVECRAQLRSFDPDFNIEITTLQVAAEELA